jgi:hypothetical protein
MGAEDIDRHRRGQGHPVPARRDHAGAVRQQPQDHQHPPGPEPRRQDRQLQHPHPSRDRKIRGKTHDAIDPTSLADDAVLASEQCTRNQFALN